MSVFLRQPLEERRELVCQSVRLGRVGEILQREEHQRERPLRPDRPRDLPLECDLVPAVVVDSGRFVDLNPTGGPGEAARARDCAGGFFGQRDERALVPGQEALPRSRMGDHDARLHTSLENGDGEPHVGLVCSDGER